MSHISLLAAAVASPGPSSLESPQHHLSDGQLAGVVLAALVVPILLATAGLCLRPKRWRSRSDDRRAAEETAPKPVTDILPHQRESAAQIRLDNEWEAATRARAQNQGARFMPPTRHGGDVLLQPVRAGESLLETSIVEVNEAEDEMPRYLQLPHLGSNDACGEQQDMEDNHLMRKRSDTETVWWAPDGSRLPYHQEDGRWYATGNDGQTRRVRACTEAGPPAAVYENAETGDRSISQAEEMDGESNRENEAEVSKEQHLHEHEGNDDAVESPGHEEEQDHQSDPESNASD